MKKIIPIIVIIMSSTFVLSAQDFRYDAGIAGGISCYMGDANQVSPWHRPGAAISGVFRFVELSVGCKDRYFSHAVFRRYP